MPAATRVMLEVPDIHGHEFTLHINRQVIRSDSISLLLSPNMIGEESFESVSYTAFGKVLYQHLTEIGGVGVIMLGRHSIVFRAAPIFDKINVIYRVLEAIKPVLDGPMYFATGPADAFTRAEFYQGMDNEQLGQLIHSYLEDLRARKEHEAAVALRVINEAVELIGALQAEEEPQPA